MFSRRSLFLVIIGVSLMIGAITFLIYQAFFNNRVLALIVAVATTLFICIMAELTVLNLAVRMLERRREQVLRQVRRKAWWSNRPFRSKTKIVDSTLAPVLAERYCPHCGSNVLLKRKIKGKPGYYCKKCAWRGQEIQLLKRRKAKKAKSLRSIEKMPEDIFEDEQSQIL